ncbi:MULTISPECIES: TraB/GumN family protein [unclassified Tatumella]|uniref:TraB/GumN family protein n=1 Tax=unclassified Tatumella TaxID=2649542 RepID=UPI001BB06137|nr:MULTISPECIES: TraB/GumN family protein [unclassified Tatumella]MBS0875810.1 TraB/GumN family protein [Tatumella sp. JGM82]MBS0890215.1 TraB/GumN family protein [Tatumella sp. JGM94]MBS0900341.1 TraB/GumN family protein [Tatumella sp. JGM100]
MVTLWKALQKLRQILMPVSYSWPATDLQVNHCRIHLVGSIHMGTRNMSPLPAPLLNQLRTADALIVEADILSAPSPLNTPGERAGLTERFTAALTAELEKRCAEYNIPRATIEHLPAWQIALILQSRQAERLGLRPEYGIDYQLLQAAKTINKPVIELEGAETQLALLTRLPDDGLALLSDSLQHWHTNARLLQTMISWWIEGPPRKKTAATLLPSTFSNPLNDTLIRQRNLAWKQQLSQLDAGRYLVAVGALHLYGDDNLPAMLVQ